MKSSVIVSTIIILLSLSSVDPIAGQSSNFNIGIGAGLPELINAGVSYNARKAIIGATVGTLPAFGQKLLTAGVNTGIHFAGTSRHTEIPPWFALAGFNFVQDIGESYGSRYTYLSVRVGREMNFSSRSALVLEGGLSFETSYSERSPGPEATWQPGDSWFPVLPYLNIKLIFRPHRV
ncbi:MAG: hypothetical protein QUS66_04400 [Bacteroidota bacterium]|jgi:hypothetical protein|nr:hypothetical protein [Bacteroidota bacterium]